MRIEVLVSTMFQNDMSLISTMNIKGDVLIVNQSNNDADESFISNDTRIRFISSKERGLSRSRNIAIKNSSGDICLFADDDITYNDDYIETIREQYKMNPSADIIVFPVPSLNPERSKSYSKKIQRIGYLRSMRVYSYEISFRRDAVIRAGVSFNELFGAGSGKYSCGEENIFLFDCLRKRLRILFVPKKIGVVSHSSSTWFNGYDDKFFFDKGAMFYAMSKPMAIAFILQYLFRKRKLYKNTTGFCGALKSMINGLIDYKNLIEEKRKDL